MVLLSAAILTRSGKVCLSRQFVEMTKARIEGLLASFTKLVPKDSDKQHTFIETDSVRYVYQKIESLFLVIITTKSSNILEDKETVKLLSKVIPEYCERNTQHEVMEHAFELIFAFDEVIALGYRESVNLAQIRMFTEMDSVNEAEEMAAYQAQVEAAKLEALKKQKELAKLRKSAQPGLSSKLNMFNRSTASDTSFSNLAVEVPIMTSHEPEKSAPAKRAPGKSGMKLGNKSNKSNKFMEDLGIDDGLGSVSISSNKKSKTKPKIVEKSAVSHPVEIALEEKVTLQMGQDGSLEKFSLNGGVSLKITEDTFNQIQFAGKLSSTPHLDTVQFNTHPNLDKKLWNSDKILKLKNASKTFPTNQAITILKWRFTTDEEDLVPILINCWPNDTGDGNCDVNIEFELQVDYLSLKNVEIIVPVPSGCGAPNVGDCDVGDYIYNKKANTLTWNIPVMDKNNSTGQIDFSMPSNPDDFFPLNVNFSSNVGMYTKVDVVSCSDLEGKPVNFGKTLSLVVEKYSIGDE